MKKRVIFCSGLMVAMLLSGCGNTALDSSSSAAETNGQSQSSVSDSGESSDTGASDTLTLEEVLAAPVSDADEFHWRNAIDGSGIYLSGGDCDDDIIVVPDEVDGKTVIGLDPNGLSFLECRAIVLPDSMQTLEDGSIGEVENLEILVYGAGMKEGVMTPTANLPSLKTIYVKDGAQNIPVIMAFGADNLEKVYLPASLDESAMSQTQLVFECATPTLVVEPGSAAEKYAKDNGYSYENP